MEGSQGRVVVEERHPQGTTHVVDDSPGDSFPTVARAIINTTVGRSPSNVGKEKPNVKDDVNLECNLPSSSKLAS